MRQKAFEILFPVISARSSGMQNETETGPSYKYTASQEIFVGFRKPSGYLTTTQVFQTVQIPRLVRGKPGAWDPNVCLAWGDRFLSFLRNTIKGSSRSNVWRIKFTSKTGVSATLLDDVGVRDVEGGEDRVGFLPRWYWEEMSGAVAYDPEARAQTRSEGESSKVGTIVVPSGWKI